MTSTLRSSREQERELIEAGLRAAPAALDAIDALRRENDQLRTALASRIVIEQAKGMLAERLDGDVDEVFKGLRRAARDRRMKLHALAAAVIAREAWAEAIFPRDQPRNGAGME